ncbi:MAG TPA: FtsL-like putative cell division protein [Cytophagaceae bacterium]|jgi:cell division protein FtsL
MAVNTLKEKEAPKVERKNLFKSLESKFRLDQVFKNGLPAQYLPYVLYISIILVLYIGNAHYAERTIRRIDKLKTEVEDLRADYTTLKAELMYASKQSEVAKKVKMLGLEESKRPPYKIIIKEGEY